MLTCELLTPRFGVICEFVRTARNAFTRNTSVPGPPSKTCGSFEAAGKISIVSLPAPPKRVSFPSKAFSRSSTWLPMIESSPSPAFTVVPVMLGNSPVSTSARSIVLSLPTPVSSTATTILCMTEQLAAPLSGLFPLIFTNPPMHSTVASDAPSRSISSSPPAVTTASTDSSVRCSSCSMPSRVRCRAREPRRTLHFE